MMRPIVNTQCNKGSWACQLYGWTRVRGTMDRTWYLVHIGVRMRAGARRDMRKIAPFEDPQE
jgi:hypothetical protein